MEETSTPLAPQIYLVTRQPVLTSESMVCAWCHKTVPRVTLWQKYCCDSHKTLAHRRKKQAATVWAAPKWGATFKPKPVTMSQPVPISTSESVDQYWEAHPELTRAQVERKLRHGNL